MARIGAFCLRGLGDLAVQLKSGGTASGEVFCKKNLLSLKDHGWFSGRHMFPLTTLLPLDTSYYATER
jgi:hypothetical protein